MKKWILITLSATMTLTTMAKTAGFQLSLTPSIAIQEKETQIDGVTLNIWGENPQRAFALGFVNGSTGDSKGFSIGLLWNYAEDYTGVQFGVVNYASGNFVGWQDAFVNVTQGSFIGFQSGCINYAGSLTGLQLGFLNYAKTANNGLQIGMINIIQDNEWFSDFPEDLAKGMVFVNWSFGGK